MFFCYMRMCNESEDFLDLKSDRKTEIVRDEDPQNYDSIERY
jgi:hypothetical protein